MKFLFDFFPIVLFFISYKIYGIYFATGTAIVASFLQVFLYWLKHRRFEKMHLISLAIICILGGATLFFHNPWFIKWKPTGIYWLTAVVFLVWPFVASKPLIQHMMGGSVDLPVHIWYRLNYAWSIFFLIMGGLNLYVAYFYSTDVWVYFKLFGGAGMTLIFVFLQALYMTKHLHHQTSNSESQEIR